MYMFDRVLIDTLSLKSRDFATRWKDAIRKSPQLRHYNKLDDVALVEANAPFYPLLARTLDRGFDLSIVGEFFIGIGKRRVCEGFPISEVVFAISLFQRTVIEYLMMEFAMELPERMCQSVRAQARVAEFCLLGSFYISKGFLEETYASMGVHNKIAEELLDKYLQDEFIFKGESSFRLDFDCYGTAD